MQLSIYHVRYNKHFVVYNYTVVKNLVFQSRIREPSSQKGREKSE